VTDVVEYVDRSFARPLTIVQLPRRMRRIEHARHLLATTPMAVTEICSRT
jgi:transcriptional regulator GlxA family with amidase domain